MKAIAIYSGKGGVGKTTVTALLGLALAKKYKVAILDVDINTPSIHVIFKEATQDNLSAFSSGYSIQRPQFTGREVKKFLKGIVSEIKEQNFDIVLLDMPPSVTDAHMVIGQEIPISSVVLVTQPNALSTSDLSNAHDMIKRYGVPISGVIENMVGVVFGESRPSYADIPVLAQIPLEQEIAEKGNAGELATLEVNPLVDVAFDVYKAADRISWEEVIASKNRDWEGEPLDDVKAKVTFFGSSDGPRGFQGKGKGNTNRGHFRGLESWDFVREVLRENEAFTDEFLTHNDAAIVRRMLEAFNDDDTALMMVLRPPTVAIPTFRGEIGYARLVLDKTGYYGVPRVEYITNAGPIIMFPHEVSPSSLEYVTMCVDEGEMMKVTGSTETRYVPVPEMMEIIDNQFGQHGDWREAYKELGITLINSEA